MSEQIEIEYKGDTLKGILLDENKDYLVIKLSSGYNANIKKSEITKEISRTKVETKEKEPKDIKQNKDLPLITILHTGGTIASKVDYATGAVTSQFTPDEILKLDPTLLEHANIDTKLIGNIFSGDLNFHHQNLMMDEIDNAVKKGSRGIIITHGTDTIQYTGPGLQYAIENLPVPVLIVGAQRSSDRPSTDAFQNLKAALDFILYNDKQSKRYLRVGLCMHSHMSDGEFVILDGINLRKMHSSRRDAFRQINYPIVATISDSVSISRKNLLSEVPKEKLNLTKFDGDIKIGFFKSHPHLMPEELKHLSYYDAVVVEGTGFGHLAVDEIDEHTKQNAQNLAELKNLVKTGTKVVMGTQCIYGIVALNVYGYGRKIQEVGVLGNHMNLTPETLFMRTAHILSKDKNKFNELWETELEGFKLRSEESEFLNL